jgi:hypothetical protein
MEDPKIALDTKIREELGLDPDELGSPWGAAGSSFLLRHRRGHPAAAFPADLRTHGLRGALALSFIALFLVGAA